MKKNLLISLSAMILIACGAKKNSTEQSIPSLSIGVMSSMDYLPLAIASEQGYFTEEGVEVKLQKFFSANDRDAAIQGKQLDGSILDYTGAVLQNAGGIEIVLTSQCEGTFELIASKASKISSTKDLKGKEFAVSNLTVVDFCTDMFLKNESVTDFSKSEIQKIPLRLEMLRNDKIDASVLPDPFATIAKADGLKAISSLDDLDLHVTGIVFTRTAIREKSDAIAAFYRAYNKGVEYIVSATKEQIAETLTKEIGFPSSELAMQVVLPSYTEAKLPSAEDMKIVCDWLVEKGALTADFNFNAMICTDFTK